MEAQENIFAADEAVEKNCGRQWLWGFIPAPEEGDISLAACTSQAGRALGLYHFWYYFGLFCYFWLASAVVT